MGLFDFFKREPKPPVLEFPEPKETAEAYMVALINVTSDQLPTGESVVGRYFTLEKGFTLSSEPRTVLAEWDTSRHSNYGSGPAAKVEDFLAVVESHLG